MSTERIDHAKEAREWVEASERVGLSMEETSAFAAIGQVHATLALVDAQRTANFIAYAQLLETQYAEAARNGTEFNWDTRADSNVRHGIALDRIREGLGL